MRGVLTSVALALALLLAAGAVEAQTPDTAPPTFAGATMNGSTLTVTFNEDLDSDSKPAASAFTLTVTPSGGGDPREIAGTSDAVSISSATVTVPLQSAVSRGETATVIYTQPPADPRLQDESGNKVVTFPTAQPVTNTTPPAFVSAAVSWTTLTVTFNADLKTTATPSALHFELTVTASDSTTRTIQGATSRVTTVSGTTVTVPLRNWVAPGERATVTYTGAGGSNSLRDANDNEVNSLLRPAGGQHRARGGDFLDACARRGH